MLKPEANTTDASTTQDVQEMEAELIKKVKPAPGNPGALKAKGLNGSTEPRPVKVGAICIPIEGL